MILGKYLLFFNFFIYIREIKILIFNLRINEVEFVKVLSILGENICYRIYDYIFLFYVGYVGVVIINKLRWILKYCLSNLKEGKKREIKK